MNSSYWEVIVFTVKKPAGTSLGMWSKLESPAKEQINTMCHLAGYAKRNTASLLRYSCQNA